MTPLLIYSLLLASLCAWSSWSVSSGMLVVTQSPDVSVMEGQTVTITCCWTREVEKSRVNWLKNKINIDAFLKNQSQGSLIKEASNCSNVTFTSITEEDSGTYSCMLIAEIPFYDKFQGNGTVITVMAREITKDDTDDHTDAPIAGGFDSDEALFYALRCLPILALVISFLYLNRLASKNQQHSPAAPGNTLPSAQRIEESPGEEERETEAE